MCSVHCLMMFYICEKFHENISLGFQLTERTLVHGRNDYVQCLKGNNSKSKQTRVTGHMFCTLSHSVLHMCEVSWIYHELWSGHEYMVEMAMFNVQRTITPKVGKPELWFMCSAHSLVVFYITVKFRENISNGIRVLERTRNHKELTDGRCHIQAFIRYFLC